MSRVALSGYYQRILVVMRASRLAPSLRSGLMLTQSASE